MELKRELLRNNAAVTLSGFAVAFISFAFSVLLARLLGPVDFGLYSLAMTVIGLFMIFTDLGMGSTMVRCIANALDRNDLGQAKTLIILLLKYRMVLLLAVGAALTLASGALATLVFQKPEAEFVILLSGFLLMVQSLEEYLRTVLVSVKDFRGVSILSVAEKLCRVAFAGGFVVIGWQVFGALIGLMIAAGASVLYCIHRILRMKPLVHAKRESIDRAGLLRFGMWASVWTVVVTIFTTADLFIISIFGTVEQIGFYRIAATWTSALITFFPISVTVLYPYFSGAAGKGKAIFAPVFRYAAMAILPLSFLLSAFAGGVIASFYGASYAEAALALQILALGGIPFMFTTILTYYFSGINKPEIPTKVTTASLALNIGLILALIFPYGIVGVAVAGLVSRVIEFILFTWAARREGTGFPFSVLLRPLIAAGIAGAVATQIPIATTPQLIAAGFGSLGLYLLVLFAIRGVSRTDVSTLFRMATRRGA